MKIGIIGYGEIGRAVDEVYKAKGLQTHIKDLDKDEGLDECRFLHICIPFSDSFITTVSDYAKQLEPEFLIIHSTVPPGTTDSITGCSNVVHSPVRGIHPNLYEGLITFPKVVAGKDCTTVAEHFRSDLGLTVREYDQAKTSEASKLLSTTYYGLCIAFHEYANTICEDNDLCFDEVMTEWNMDYNQGYKELGINNVVRPVLYAPKGKIGGHCVVPNANILKSVKNSPILDSILDLK